MSFSPEAKEVETCDADFSYDVLQAELREARTQASLLEVHGAIAADLVAHAIPNWTH